MRLYTYQSFALFYIFFSEKELAIQVREVDGVQVEESDMAKASEHKILYWTNFRIKIL